MSDNVNVLCISRAYGLHAGGMEKLSWELVQHLRQERDLNVATIVHETPSGTSLSRVRFGSALFALMVIPKALRAARNADVVHLGDPVLSLIGWLIQRVIGTPVAVTVHGLDVAHPNPLYQLYLALFFRSFNAYFPISSYAATKLAEHNVRGNIIQIFPGITDRAWPDETVARTQLEHLIGSSIKGRVLLGTAGRLMKRKGHGWFIERVLPKLPDNVVYVIAGEGPEQLHIETVVNNLKLQHRVYLLGRISDADLALFYRGIDIFVQPNIPVEGDAEGFGLVLLEAALAERPVLAANLEGINDAIDDEKNGHLVSAQDPDAWAAALCALMSRSVYHAPNARAYTLEKFSWNRIATLYKNALTAICR